MSISIAGVRCAHVNIIAILSGHLCLDRRHLVELSGLGSSAQFCSLLLYLSVWLVDKRKFRGSGNPSHIATTEFYQLASILLKLKVVDHSMLDWGNWRFEQVIR